MNNKSNLLFKLEKIKNHNTIITMKTRMKEEKKKEKELFLEYKKLINKKEQELKKIKEENDILKQENGILKNEKIVYMNILNRLPKFVIRLFYGKSIKLEGDKNGRRKRVY